MKTITVEAPAMYGDHHVIEVRRILLEKPGVEDVYASSSFRVVEIHYDDSRVSPDDLHKLLEQAGYLGELPIPTETGTAGSQQDGKRAFFRHSTASEQVKEVVSFTQSVPYVGRPLWPCPGLGPLPNQQTREES